MLLVLGFPLSREDSFFTAKRYQLWNTCKSSRLDEKAVKKHEKPKILLAKSSIICYDTYVVFSILEKSYG